VRLSGFEGKILTKKSHIDASLSREHNRKLILKFILTKSVSRIGLAALTGLSRAGVGVIVNSLMADGFLEEAIHKRPIKGKQPKLLSIRNDALYAVGINITRSGSAVGICGLNGTILVQKNIESGKFKNPDSGVAFLSREVKKMLSSLDLPPEKLVGAGLTTPGPVDGVQGLVLTPPDFALWENYPVKQAFERSLNMPVYLENNALARTIEELYYGLGKNYSSFICLVVDNGVGCGIVINDKLIKGTDGFGSEFGHTTVDINGERCFCGNIGCLELYANPRRFITQAVQKGYAVSSWDEIARRASQGEAFFEDSVKNMASYIAAGCINLINLLEPQAIIIAGELNRGPDLLVKTIQSQVDQRTINRQIRHVEILASEIGVNHGVMAAAVVCFNNYLSSPV
jgi:predicted NBD/HSP70 family sugar kinase